MTRRSSAPPTKLLPYERHRWPIAAHRGPACSKSPATTLHSARIARLTLALNAHVVRRPIVIARPKENEWVGKSLNPDATQWLQSPILEDTDVTITVWGR